MQTSEHSHETGANEASSPHHTRRWLFAGAFLLLVVLVLTLVPPLLNVSRLQRRIAGNIGASLGRPVHFDRVTLSLLPLPGFTLERFVVDEDPAFGFEPILRADEVRANVRISSLWSHHVEFSKITLTDPSVNLVHASNGRWNLQSVLVQASHIQAAPTAQRTAGPAPRFPYIEASGARINLKLDQEKTPFAFTDADFSLWLPEPRQWHFRLEAHPARTDTGPADTGVARVEGILGGADSGAKTLRPEQIPLQISGNWQNVQLGGLSRLLFGRDAGVRGDLAVMFNITGALDHAEIATHFSLAHARREDYVPPYSLALEASCNALAEAVFHRFSSIECHWPPAGSSDHSLLIATGTVPDTEHSEGSSAELTLPALPAATLLDWLRVATPHPPTGLTSSGTVAGTLAWHAEHPADRSAWSGELEFSGESLSIPALGAAPVPLGDMLLRSAVPIAASSGRAQKAAKPAAENEAVAGALGKGFDLLPILLPLGGHQPVTLIGHFDTGGYTLHLDGTAIPKRLLALGDAIPQFGDGLRQLLEPSSDLAEPHDAHDGDIQSAKGTSSSSIANPVRASDSHKQDGSTAEEPVHLDLTAVRQWGGAQVWSENSPVPPRRSVQHSR